MGWLQRDIAEYLTKCPNFQQVKDEHQKPSCQIQEMGEPKWMWKEINMDFVVGLPLTR